MAIARNQPCFCGSGKKYKKCCIDKKPEDYAESQEPFDEEDDFYEQEPFDEDDDFYEQAVILQGLVNMRRLFLDSKPHIKKYEKTRKLHSEIASKMMDYFYDGKFERKIDTDYVYPYEPEQKMADETLTFTEINFPNNEIGTRGLCDMMLYKTAPNMNSIVEEFINKRRYQKPEKVEFLQSMLNSKLGLFEITEIDFDEAYAYIKDVFTGTEYKIIDIGLTNNNGYKDIYFYTRIITYNNLSFSTGLNIIFRKSDPFIRDFIKNKKKDFKPEGEFLRFSELYSRFLHDTNRVRALTNQF